LVNGKNLVPNKPPIKIEKPPVLMNRLVNFLTEYFLPNYDGSIKSINKQDEMLEEQRKENGKKQRITMSYDIA